MTGTPTLEDGKKRFLRSGDKAANYRSTLDRAIEKFFSQLPDSVEHVDEIDKRHLGFYAEYLVRRIDSGAITNGTAWTYYDCVSSFLGYCVRWDWLSENPAQKQLGLDEMPARPRHRAQDQQIWSEGDRKRLVRYVDRRADQALDEQGLDAITELRDRALVYVLAYSGVRGGEILSDPRDPERNGITWDDVDLEENVLIVLEKNREMGEVQLPAKTHGALERLHRALDPSSGDWPVFPTNHAPTLASGLPVDLDTTDDPYLDLYREHDLSPSSLTTNGARDLLQRFCEDAGIDVEEDYLKPHGARRGLGEKLYREKGAAAAQRTLRHEDPETTAKHYSHIEAGELAEEVNDVIEDE